MNIQSTKTIALARTCLNPVLLCVMVTLLLSYGYLLFMTVAHVVIQKEFAYEQSELANKLTSLEAEYIAMQHRISQEISASVDLVATDQKIYISKDSPSLVLGATDGG